MTRHLLYVILFCLTSISFVVWRVFAVRNRDIAHFAIVEDHSVSHKVGCASLVGLSEHVLEGVASPGSTLTVLILGDRLTANEPWRLGTYAVPSVRKVLEGKSAKLRQQRQILQDISSKCQALRESTISPIFLGVVQGINDLHARGCKATSHCQLFVNTDLEENVEPAMKKILGRNDGPKQTSLLPVDNRGIGVVFCGIAVTNSRRPDYAERGTERFVTRNSNQIYRMQKVWRSLFAEPAGVSFEPYCPTPTDTEHRP